MTLENDRPYHYIVHWRSIQWILIVLKFALFMLLKSWKNPLLFCIFWHIFRKSGNFKIVKNGLIQFLWVHKMIGITPFHIVHLRFIQWILIVLIYTLIMTLKVEKSPRFSYFIRIFGKSGKFPIMKKQTFSVSVSL